MNFLREYLAGSFDPPPPRLLVVGSRKSAERWCQQQGVDARASYVRVLRRREQVLGLRIDPTVTVVRLHDANPEVVEEIRRRRLIDAA